MNLGALGFKEKGSGEFDVDVGDGAPAILGNCWATSGRLVSTAGALFAPKIMVQIAKAFKARKLTKNVR